MTIALEAFGKGLFFAEGEEWKIKRSLYSKVFHFDILKYQQTQMVSIVDECIGNLVKGPTKKNIVLFEWIIQVTGNINLNVFLGEKVRK